MTRKFEVNVDGTRHTVYADADVPLWVIRDYVGLRGAAPTVTRRPDEPQPTQVDEEPAKK